MTSYNTDGTVGPWAEEKLECLSKYLSAYTTILRRQSWCKGYFYIDAFAGAGVARLRDGTSGSASLSLLQQISEWTEDEDNAEYVLGSPHRALGIEHPFTQYLFIEANSKRCDELNNIVDQYPNTHNVQVVEGDANDVLVNRVVNNNHIDWKKYRAVVFLDPFGMQVPWTTLQSLALTKSIEVIINFPVGMVIQRLLHADGKIPGERRSMLDRYFGTTEWEDVVYQDQQDLFGETSKVKFGNSGNRIAKWYRQRLQDEFGFATPARLIRNSRGTPLYYLLFAGPHPKGAEIAEHVLSQGEVVK